MAAAIEPGNLLKSHQAQHQAQRDDVTIDDKIRMLAQVQETLFQEGEIETERLRAQIDHIKDTLKYQNQRNIDLKKIVDDHLQLLEKEQGRSRELQGSIEAKIDQIAELKRTCSQQKRQIGDLLRTVEEHKVQIIACKGEIVQLQETVESQSSSIQEQKEVVTGHEGRIAELSDLLREKENLIASKTSDIQALQEKSRDQVVEIDRLAKELKGIKTLYRVDDGLLQRHRDFWGF